MIKYTNIHFKIYSFPTHTFPTHTTYIKDSNLTQSITYKQSVNISYEFHTRLSTLNCSNDATKCRDERGTLLYSTLSLFANTINTTQSIVHHKQVLPMQHPPHVIFPSSRIPVVWWIAFSPMKVWVLVRIHLGAMLTYMGCDFFRASNSR